jgi:hypothetical protein
MRDLFVGRTAELSLLTEAFDAACVGRTTTVLLSGEPGVGKTLLAEHAARGFAGRGAQLLRGKAWDFGGAPALWPWAEVIHSATAGWSRESLLAATGTNARLQRLSEVCPDLEDRAGPRQPDAPGDWGRLERFEAVARLLTHRAASATQVVLLDDIHAADAPTLQLLLFLNRRLTACPVLIVATARSVGFSASDEVMGLLGDVRQHSRVLPLAGLDEPALRQWLEGGVGFAPDGSWLRRFWSRTRGNPLFVRGLLLSAAERGDVSTLGATEVALPTDVLRAVDLRLAGLPARVRELIEVAAVFGRAFTAQQLSAAGAAQDALGLMTDAARAGILERRGDTDGWDFSHGLFRESLYPSLSADRRAELHLAVARSLEREVPAASAAELARHFRGAGMREPLLAVQWSWRAADDAMAATDYAESAMHCRRAREWLARLPTAESHSWSVRLLLGEARAQLALGDQLSAKALYREAGALAEVQRLPAALADVALGFARTGEYGGKDEERQRWLDKALAVAAALPAPLRAQVLARHAMESWAQTRPEGRTEESLLEALALARESGDPETLAAVLTMSLQALGAPEELSTRIALCDELSATLQELPDLAWKLEGHRWRLNLSIELGDITTARREVEAYSRVAEASRRPQLIANARLREGFIPSLLGDFDALALNATATRDAQRQAQDPQAETIYLSRRALDCGDSGALDELATVLPPLRDEVNRIPHFLFYRAILIHALVAQGDLPQARTEWETLHARGLEDLPRNFTTLATLCLLAEPAVALSDRPRAEALYARLLPYGGAHASIGASRSLGPVGYHAALLARFLGAEAEMRALLEKAEALSHQLGAAFWLQRVRALAGSAAVARVQSARFVREGKEWHLEFGGVSARAPDGRGLRLLAELLARPGESIPVLELAGPTPDGGERTEQHEAPLLDAQALRAYRARVATLREALEDAEAMGRSERAEALRSELDAIAAELKRATGLGGRARVTSGPAERARVAVTKALTRAIAALRPVHPALAEHLEACVTTGSRCRYAPSQHAPVTWNVIV